MGVLVEATAYTEDAKLTDAMAHPEDAKWANVKRSH
jgi:hypothetical protein